MDTQEKMVWIAKRDRNRKRNYLVVNRFQGKHIPVKPRAAGVLFSALAEELKQTYAGERLLCIGFAETATAIGAAVAGALDCRYIQTTRETIPSVSYLFFSESHSHATEQKVVKDDLDAVMGQIDRIIFLEDEVTTGNTIWKLIELIRQIDCCSVAFAVASLLNGMDAAAAARYQEQRIPLHYLVKTSHERYAAIAEQFVLDGAYHEPAQARRPAVCLTCSESYLDARRMVQGGEYLRACEALWQSVRRTEAEKFSGSVLVLGTEEFMFPAYYVAAQIEKMGADVRFHATTRSPILVSQDPDYPLHTRYTLRSLYAAERITYVYDLDRYDHVFVITDAAFVSAEAGGLTAALEQQGNRDITLIRWCKV